jgi:peptidylprolyl isomerase
MIKHLLILRNLIIFLLAVTIVTGCKVQTADDRTVTENSTILVEYVASLHDGSVFAKTPDDMPKKINVSSPDIVKGLREGIIGMRKGETRVIIVDPEDGYGLRDESKRTFVSNESIPENFIPRIGKILRMNDAGGNLIIGIIININNDGVELDTNHLLAGKELVYNIKVVEIE